MLEQLKLENVGPAPSVVVDFAPGVNLLTGDNGLGKTFLLDTAWWALTRRWPRDVNRRMTSGFPARPMDPTRPASIAFSIVGQGGPFADSAVFQRHEQAWRGWRGRPAMPCLIVYAHADGSFSVWDPARNYRQAQPVGTDIQERRPAYVFTEEEVWDGLRDTVNGRQVPVCNGLLYDWSTWIRANDENARTMAAALRTLSPGHEPNGLIEPAPPVRLSVDDARDVPSIRSDYQGTVPILLASSGVRRIASLAYMLTWSWSEHRAAAALRGDDPSGRVVMLFDEVESHLHPKWQRSVLGALRGLGDVLSVDQLQILVATHSPLVLASAEPWFDPERDAWFDLDVAGEPPRVQVQRRHFTPRGTVGAWLTSEAFDLETDRSIEAEQAIRAAGSIQQQEEPELDDIMSAHHALRRALPDIDRFWVRWNAFVEANGGSP